MATFEANNAGADMMALFTWADGVTPIGGFQAVDPFSVIVLPESGTTVVLYGGATVPGGLTHDASTPLGGTFTYVALIDSGSNPLGTLSGFTVETDNFTHIIDERAYDILDGDDTLIGGDGVDILFGGFAGVDSYFGDGGIDGTVGDTFVVSSRDVGASSFTGTPGQTDTIKVIADINGFDTLNLRGATLSSMNRIETDGLNVQIAAGQVDHGLSKSATVVTTSGTAVLGVFMAGTTNVDLSGFTIGAGVAVSILGTTAAETITATNVNDILIPDQGTDTVRALGGNDLIYVRGTDSEFDTFDGGSGTDTIEVFGLDALVLDHFDAAAQSFEVWTGHGQGLAGNGGDNTLNLAGLTAMTGLLAVDGMAGDDAITGSKFRDELFGGDGRDTISGGDDADDVEGGLGADTMAGGAGSDVFDFGSIVEIGKKKGVRDIITDFAKGDRIDLSTIDANGAKTGEGTFKFKNKEGTSLKKAGDLVYEQIDKKGTDKDMTVVYGDVNGDKKADFALELKGIVDLSKGDFLL